MPRRLNLKPTGHRKENELMFAEISLALHLEIEYRKYLWRGGLGNINWRPQSKRHWLDSNPQVTQGV